MAELHAQSANVIVNVFLVEPASGKPGIYQNPHFLKRGMMPVELASSMPPLIVDGLQYECVETCYDIFHHEVIAFVMQDESKQHVIGVDKAIVPDSARYSGHTS